MKLSHQLLSAWDCSLSRALYICIASTFHTILALLTVVTRDEVYKTVLIISGSGWPREPRRGSTVTRFLGLRVHIPPGV